ncbi:uncharacterized protein LOC135190864 [Pogoniulus pusillus]|uniref:uncharacterized protein LOC135190864 n=1 Tax=Pogoniulus pusillus TaxID=488313 RepID=UPI0030B9962D
MRPQAAWKRRAEERVHSPAEGEPSAFQTQAEGRSARQAGGVLTRAKLRASLLPPGAGALRDLEQGALRWGRTWLPGQPPGSALAAPLCPCEPRSAAGRGQRQAEPGRAGRGGRQRAAKELCTFVLASGFGFFFFFFFCSQLFAVGAFQPDRAKRLCTSVSIYKLGLPSPRAARPRSRIHSPLPLPPALSRRPTGPGAGSGAHCIASPMPRTHSGGDFVGSLSCLSPHPQAASPACQGRHDGLLVPEYPRHVLPPLSLGGTAGRSRGWEAEGRVPILIPPGGYEGVYSSLLCAHLHRKRGVVGCGFEAVQRPRGAPGLRVLGVQGLCRWGLCRAAPPRRPLPAWDSFSLSAPPKREFPGSAANSRSTAQPLAQRAPSAETVAGTPSSPNRFSSLIQQ